MKKTRYEYNGKISDIRKNLHVNSINKNYK